MSSPLPLVGDSVQTLLKLLKLPETKNQSECISLSLYTLTLIFVTQEGLFARTSLMSSPLPLVGDSVQTLLKLLKLPETKNQSECISLSLYTLTLIFVTQEGLFARTSLMSSPLPLVGDSVQTLLKLLKLPETKNQSKCISLSLYTLTLIFVTQEGLFARTSLMSSPLPLVGDSVQTLLKLLKLPETKNQSKCISLSLYTLTLIFVTQEGFEPSTLRSEV